MAGREILARSEPGFALPAIERIAPVPPHEVLAAYVEALSSPGDIVLDLNGRGGWVARAAVDRQRRAVTLESSPLTRLVAEVVLRPPDLRHLDAAFQALAAAPRGETSLKVSIGELFSTRCPTCGRAVVADEFVWEGSDDERRADDGHRRAGRDELREAPRPAGGQSVGHDPAGSRGDRQAAGGPSEGRRHRPAGADSPGRSRTADDSAASRIDGPHSRPDREHDGLALMGSAEGGEGVAGPRLTRKHCRCLYCRDQVGGGEQRHAPADAADIDRARDVVPNDHMWRMLHERFPTLDGNDTLVEQLLDLHSTRQLIGLGAILERLDADLRAAPVEAALRLALMHALLPASRLNGYPGRVAALRIAGGRVKLPGGTQWRERNPWLAFEDGFRVVRGFVQRLEGTALGPLQARFGEDIRSLGEGAANAVVKVGTPASFRAIAAEAAVVGRGTSYPAVRLVLGQPPLRPSTERLSFTYLATAWLLGREAAATLPLEPLFAGSSRAPWGWQAAAIARQLEGIAPLLARDSRVVLLVEGGGAEALVAAALGGVRAGYRLVAARLVEPGEETGGAVEFVPPAAALPGGARTRANVRLWPPRGGPGDLDLVPSRGLFAPPERFDHARLTAADVAHTVSDTAIAILKARGEPARYERLLGEIIVGLDRAGQLHPIVAPGEDESPASTSPGAETPAGTGRTGALDGSGRGSAGLRHPDPGEVRAGRGPGPAQGMEDGTGVVPQALPDRGFTGAPREAAGARFVAEAARDSGVAGARRPLASPVIAPGTDPVEGLLSLIRGELVRPDHRRLRQIEPERWWLASRDDEEAAATPLADRVEWAVFSLLSTAGRLSETGFFERIAGMFGGHDLPDEALVRACLESYRSRASTVDAIHTGDDLLRRSQEHGELIALLADHGHNLGMSVWIGRREQERRIAGRPLASLLDERERRIYIPLVARGPVEDIEQIDCIWYVRSRAAFLFEVEWTAMLHEPVLRRGRRIPQTPEIVRFLVIPPERAELVRYKLHRSPLLRVALEEDNWHILKANHLRSLVSREQPSLADLEPYLGLDPPADRIGEQMPLFE